MTKFRFEVTPEQFGELLRLRIKASAWIDTLPREVREAFFDNPHTDALHRMIDVFVNSCQDYDFDWLLNEWSTNPDLELIEDDVEVTLDTIEDVVEYLKTKT